ncbi:aldo-keto reductase yakc [Mycena rosella]|uniref:Aldo-keto reductase yakc n=1 Tax=Mycena rosella TaxID=1033263 RepID=A0AAD7D5K9_MYCRO|nr:aldo-keto reductase yakc [Mycena rosella]
MVKSAAFADIQVAVPGFGCMGLSKGLGATMTLEQAEPVLLKALELGCTFWDTAVIYGVGINEQLLGEFLKKHNARDKVFLASKCGVAINWETRMPSGMTNSATHIKEYIEGTISRLQTTPDLYYLHRRDPKTPLEESIPALDELRKAGKTKYIGLCECSAETLRKAHSIAKIDAIQAEYSLFETVHETTGLLDTAKELGIAFVAYSPMGHGFLTGAFNFFPDRVFFTAPKFLPENFDHNLRMVNALEVLAVKKGVKPGQLAIAWVAAQGCIPIPGTVQPGRLEENWAARDIEFTEDELKELRALVVDAKPLGERYAPQHAAAIGH